MPLTPLTPNPNDPWHLVKTGQFQQAVEAYTRLIAEEPHLYVYRTNRGYAYLNLRDYAAATEDFAAVVHIELQNRWGYTDTSFIHLGLCYWCQHQWAQAVATWKGGFGALYTDAAGGVELPALLLYAALRLGDAALRRESWTRLRKAARRKSLRAWPGAIVPYLLGKSSVEDLYGAAVAPPVTSPILQQRQTCQADFYRGLHGLLVDDGEAFQSGMRACAASGYGWLEHEYYLAQWEITEEFPVIASEFMASSSSEPGSTPTHEP